MRRLLALLLMIGGFHPLFSQSTFIPYNRDYYQLIERLNLKYSDNNNYLRTTFKPIKRSDLAEFLLKIKEKRGEFSPQDQFNFDFLMNDSWEFTKSETSDSEKNLWDLLYLKKSDLYYYKSANFDLHINPVIEFTGGTDSDNDLTLFTNTRGAEARGMIDNKIGFYTFVTTTQARFPQYVFNQIRGVKRAFPNEGFWKEFGTDAWDLTHARAYITFNLTPSIHIQAGYDKNFIGDGHRSMILSDFSSPYSFLKISTDLGPFQYTNLFAELTEDIIFGSVNPGDGDYPKKFMSMHRLAVQLTPRVSLGLFEAIISPKADINYFNPVIFYRAIEQQQGSPDNILLGLDFKWDVQNKFSFYGQFLLDEFVLDALRDGGGDWRNKFGVQLGGKYFDAFDIPTLDLQAEYNLARPYFYAYEDPALSYSNYRNPLAHPRGANFKEVVLKAQYQPKNRLTVYGKLIYADFGEDEPGINYGGNVLLDTDDRIGQNGIVLGQGIGTTKTFIEARASYMWKHNLFFDLTLVNRNFNSDLDVRDLNSTIAKISLRWNLARRLHDF